MLPDILIYGKDGSGYLDSDEIFTATIHETAHLTHWQNAGAYRFAAVGHFVRESWCVGVEWFITQMEYRERGIANYAGPDYDAATLTYPLAFGHQDWLNEGRNNHLPDYSSLFIDLFDNFNQLNQRFNNSIDSDIDDQVTGYTFQNIEQQVLRYTESRSDLQSRLKTYKPANVTDAQIDILFTNF